jgi:FkbM family methyltransferase
VGKKITNSIKKMISSFNYYRSKYGILTSLRVLNHFRFRMMNKHNQINHETKILVNGYEMFLKPNDPGISTELSIFKSHEPLNTKILSSLIKKGMTCIDIGGNIGYYVLLERKLIGSQGTLIAIEPEPKNFFYLNKNIKLHGYQNISTFNFACGEIDQVADFFIHKKSNGCQVIRKDVSPPSPKKGTISQVEVKRLDSIIDEFYLNSVDFIRMDAEGYELHILKGLKNTLKKFKPIISLELHVRQLGLEGTRQFFSLMCSLNYEIHSYVSRDLDIPLVGSINDITQPTIENLLKMIETNQTGNYLMLNLINSSNSNIVKNKISNSDI